MNAGGNTGLLVSVRSAEEASHALAGGADLIDVKEPRRGSLGYAEPEIWREVQQAVAGRAPTSAALGELLTDPVETLAAQADGFRYAKIGLAGCGNDSAWRAKWTRAFRLLPENVAPVAVIYADWRVANSPSPDEVLQAASELGVRMLLVDTWDKQSGPLLEHLSIANLAQLARAAEREQIALVLAGSLKLETLPQLLPLRPRYVAVRGAVCRGERSGEIDERLVAEFASAVQMSGDLSRPNKHCSEKKCDSFSAPETA